MADRRLTAAFIASIALHATVLFSRGWDSEERIELGAPPRLDARLASAKQASPAPADASASVRPRATPKPKPRPAARPDLPSAQLRTDEPASLPPPEPAVVAEQPQPESPPQPEAAATPEPPAAAATTTEPALPASGRIRFALVRGEEGLEIGQAIHTWRIEEGRYELRSVMETTGLAALIHSVKVTQVSKGEMTASGLRPNSFRVERDGRMTEMANFDWPGRSLTYATGGRHAQAELRDGSQDLLSAFYQLVLVPLSSPDIVSVPVATGKSYNLHPMSLQGEEQVNSRLGRLRTHLIRIGQPNDQRIDVWLAPDYANLPVRIRLIDRRGTISDQVATEIEYAGVKLVAPAGPVLQPH